MLMVHIVSVDHLDRGSSRGRGCIFAGGKPVIGVTMAAVGIDDRDRRQQEKQCVSKSLTSFC